MLSRIVLAGLIPAIMAKPIMLRSEANMHSRDGVENLEPSNLLNPNGDDKCGCNAECGEEDGIAGMVMCLEDCLEKCPDGEDIRSRQVVLPFPGEGPSHCAMKCDEDCSAVGIPFAEFSQCRDTCAASCSNADQSVTIIESKAKRQIAGFEATTYEGCMSACRSDCTTIDTAAVFLNHCDDACESQCAEYAHFGAGIVAKRQLDGLLGGLSDNSNTPQRPGAEPLQSGPTLGNGATSYEGCMSSCKSDCQNVDMGALHLNQCDDACEDQCQGFAHAASGVLPKRQAAPLQSGPTLGSGATTYEGCMASCRSDCQNVNMGALHLNQCDDGCESQCARFAHSSSGILPREPAVQAPRQVAPFIVASGATAYENCMAECGSDCVTIDTAAVFLNHCKDNCASRCARYASVEEQAAILTKKAAPAEKRQGGPLQSGPILGSGATSYEGCMAECRSDCQNVNTAALHLNQCDKNCESQCAGFSHSSQGILPRAEQAEETAEAPAVEKRHVGAAPLQNGPVITNGAETYESCLGRCNSDCQGQNLAFQIGRCEEGCAGICQSYAAGGSSIIGG